MEDQEETLLGMFASEGENQDIELCSKRWMFNRFNSNFSTNLLFRSKYCEPVVIQDDYEFEKEEL